MAAQVTVRPLPGLGLPAGGTRSSSRFLGHEHPARDLPVAQPPNATRGTGRSLGVPVAVGGWSLVCDGREWVTAAAPTSIEPKPVPLTPTTCDPSDKTPLRHVRPDLGHQSGQHAHPRAGVPIVSSTKTTTTNRSCLGSMSASHGQWGGAPPDCQTNNHPTRRGRDRSLVAGL